MLITQTPVNLRSNSAPWTPPLMSPNWFHFSLREHGRTLSYQATLLLRRPSAVAKGRHCCLASIAIWLFDCPMLLISWQLVFSPVFTTFSVNYNGGIHLKQSCIMHSVATAIMKSSLGKNFSYHAPPKCTSCRLFFFSLPSVLSKTSCAFISTIWTSIQHRMALKWNHRKLNQI